MPKLNFKRWLPPALTRIPLRLVLVVPFVIQIVGVVALTGWLSFQNGQNAVDNLVQQLSSEVSNRVYQHLNAYLAAPHQLNQLNANAVQLEALNLNNYEQMGRYFWKELQIFNVGYIGYAPAGGGHIAAGYFRDPDRPVIDELSERTQGKNHVYTVDREGNRQAISFTVFGYDPRTESWYPETVEAKKPVWSNIYHWDENQDILAITASYPLYSAADQLLGVLYADLRLSQISEFLRQTKVSPSGRVFILEQDGLLVASSAPEQPYQLVNGKAIRLSGNNSPDRLIQQSATQLHQSFPNWRAITQPQQVTFNLDGDRHFLQVVPWKDRYGLDWLIVVAVPESDFTKEINANTQRTLGLCVLALLLTTGTGFLTARWITRPILQLQRATQRLAAGETEPIAVHLSNELGGLTQAFNQMAAELQQVLHHNSRINRELSQFLDALPVGIFIADRDGQPYYLNQLGQEILGQGVTQIETPEHLRWTYRVYQAGTNFLYPADRDPVLSALRGQRVTVNDMEIRRQDGKTLVQSSGTPIFDAEGRVIFAIAAFQDITEREQAREALERSEQRYAALTKSAPVGIFRLDAQGRCEYANAQALAMMGLPEATSIQSDLSENLHPEDRDRVLQAWAQALRDDVPFACEHRWLHPDGTVVWVDGRATSEKNAAGEITGFVGTILDITERKQVEEGRRRAEAALQKSETYLRTVIDHFPLTLWAVDRNGVFTLSEGKGLEGMGLKPGDAVGVSVFELCCNVPVVTAAFRRTLETGAPYHVFAEINGCVLEDMGTVLRDEQGTIQGIIGVSMDITKRKRAEAALQLSETRLKTVLENASVLISSIRMFDDRSWEYDYISPRAEAILGFTAGQLEAHQNLWFSRILPEDRALVRAEFEQLFAKLNVTIEYRFRHKDGRVRWLSHTFICQRDRGKTDSTITGVVSDITERKEAEQLLADYNRSLEMQIAERTAALQESERRFRSIFQNAGISVLLTNLEGRCILTNPEASRMFGYSEEEFRRLRFHDFTHPDDLQADLTLNADLMAGKRDIFKLEKRYLHRDGSIVWGRLTLSAHRDASGQLLYTIGMIEDISDRKQAELELQQAKEAAEAASYAKSTFLANMSHELRTPLNAILGFAQVMRRDPATTLEQQRSLQIINRSGEHLLSLINNVLDLSKIEAGRMDLAESSFDLLGLLQTVEAMLRQRAESKGLQFLVQVAAGTPQFVLGDPNKLRQVLINLLGNAIKFTERGNVILRVATQETSDRSVPDAALSLLTFEVEDTGIGIAPEDLNQIFEAFLQARSGRTAVEGTGLGLTISQHFVELMGGKLAVQSELGRGSTFAFAIPCRCAAASEERSLLVDRPAVPVSTHSATLRILIADDQRENRELLVQLLAPLQAETRQATNGEEAVALWQEWHPHLILMDIRMPLMNGYTATRRIREAEARSLAEGITLSSEAAATKIIALSGGVLESEQTAAAAAGCDDFLSKPVKEAALFGKILQHLGILYHDAKPVPAQENSMAIDPLVAEVSVSPAWRTQISSEWIEQVRQAAVRCDDERIAQLLGQLPMAQSAVARKLRGLASNFQFDQILTLLNGDSPKP